MKPYRYVAAAILAACAASWSFASGAVDTTPIECGSCEAWNAPQPPFRLHGDSWYVGPHGLSVVLIDTGAGLILLDGALPQSVAGIQANLRALGRDLTEVKWIAVSHAHHDHVGGVAALARLSGARVAASPRAGQALHAGTVPADDPQAGFGDAMRFPPVAKVVELADGESISLGSITLTAHHTPGHTPGGTTWTWRSCEAGTCLDLVYADSLNAVSAPGFAFSAEGGVPARTLQRSIAKVRELPCDIMVAVHPGFAGLFDRLEAAQAAGNASPFIDPHACRNYADQAAERLQARLAQEAAESRDRQTPK